MNAKKKLFHERPLFYAFLALMFAIATSKFVFDGNLKYIILDALLLLLFIAFCIWAKNFKVLIVVLAVFAFGLGWFFVGEAGFYGKAYLGEVQVVGRISDDINHSSYGGSARVVLKNVQIEGQPAKNVQLTINYDNPQQVVPGAIITFNAHVQQNSLFTLGKFNTSAYRKRTAYVCEVDIDDVAVQGNYLKGVEKYRLKVEAVLKQNMGERNAAVAYAVLFGNKNQLDNEVRDAYAYAGIMHLLSVSGLHVSFLIAFLGWILQKCRVRGIWNLLVCTVFLGCYAYLCSFSPSVLRAGLMGMVLFFTTISGKCYDRLNSLGLAGILILLFSPLSGYDVGFLMSFFSVMTICLLVPKLTKLLKKFLPNAVAKSFAVTLAAEIGIFPFVSQIEGVLNFLSPVVNLIAVPIFGIIFPTLFVFSLLTAGLPFLGFVLKACGWGLGAIESIAKFFGKTGLILNLQPLDIFFIAFFFLGFFFLCNIFLAKRKVKVACSTLAFVIAGLFLGLSFVQMPVKASLSYGYSNSYSMVVISNSSGESLAVDVARKSFARSFVQSVGLQKVETMFVLQKPSILTDGASAVGVKNIVRSDDGQGYDNEQLFDFDTAGAVGNFKFVFKSFKKRLLGLEISFDQTSVFVLKDWTQSDEALSTLSNAHYDFVILGKHDQYASYFNSDALFLTYYNSPSSASSFEMEGNVSYCINGKNYIRRSLD